ncbi:S8 family serine peptidase [Actinoplanes hulinensis]|uniref:S8 family serine peptidase n=1 Tax=Actinoplanes hulinensis TaxID=1144547 RepID=A0ABS7B6S6_9ACTN|nr:S8 family serine peptidase [Actinoplanes hulinensis]MBW6436753.1 S8 family serine peptidase [Actinoplanes hulinensis]
MKVAALFLSIIVPILGVPVPAFAAPGQNCAEPGRDQIGGSWPRAMLQADAVTPLENGAGITVAVLSTGVDAGQPQFGNRVLAGAGVIGAGRANQDCTGAGTQVAGVISGRRAGGDNDVAGLSPASRILPVRVMLDDPAGSEPTPDSLAQGITVAVQNGADVVVVAAPVYDDDRDLEAAVATAAARNVVVVAAVGDLGGPDEPNPKPYPASYPNVLGVGAIDQTGRIWPDSQRGDYVDLVAPGVAVPTLQTGRGLVEVDGTAVAAGFVGATAALTRARRPGLNAAETARHLVATASPAPTGPAFGAGVINPYAALTAQVVDTEARRLPALQAPPTAADAAELQRRTIALTGAATAAVLVLVLLLTAAALRRSRRRHWRPGLPPRLHTPPEPLEPGPPVMLLDEPSKPLDPAPRR